MISIIELGISLFLIVDFITRLIRARSKRNYFLRYYGWLDFLGSLPIPGFRLGRLIKAIIFYPRLRRADIKEMEFVVIERRAKSTLLAVLLVGIVVLELSSIAILNAEQGSANGNIKNASDALWWGYVTVTTVGYGDRYPVTNQGRIVGLFLLTVGVAIFSDVTSFLADWFRQSRQSKPKEVAEENKLPVKRRKRERPLAEEEKVARHNFLSSPNESPPDSVQREEMERKFKEALRALPPDRRSSFRCGPSKT